MKRRPASAADRKVAPTSLALPRRSFESPLQARQATESGSSLTLLAVVLGTFMLFLDVTIVVVALSDVQDARRELRPPAVNARRLRALARCAAVAGSLADSYGRRRLFAVGLFIFTVGSLLCGLAPPRSAWCSSARSKARAAR